MGKEEKRGTKKNCNVGAWCLFDRTDHILCLSNIGYFTLNPFTNTKSTTTNKSLYSAIAAIDPTSKKWLAFYGGSGTNLTVLNSDGTEKTANMQKHVQVGLLVVGQQV